MKCRIPQIHINFTPNTLVFIVANMGEIVENNTELNGTGRTRAPSLNSLSLTEYSSKPSPSQSSKNDLRKVIPDEYLLPNGYPDVKRHSEIKYLCI